MTHQLVECNTLIHSGLDGLDIYSIMWLTEY